MSLISAVVAVCSRCCWFLFIVRLLVFGRSFVGLWSLVVGRSFVGLWSLVVGRSFVVLWSLVVGRCSLVVGRWSLVVGRWLLVLFHARAWLVEKCHQFKFKFKLWRACWRGHGGVSEVRLC